MKLLFAILRFTPNVSCALCGGPVPAGTIMCTACAYINDGGSQ